MGYFNKETNENTQNYIFVVFNDKYKNCEKKDPNSSLKVSKKYITRCMNNK